MRTFRDRIGPKYNKESPLGKLLYHTHSGEFGVLSRMGGLLLLIGAVLALVAFLGNWSVFR